MNSSERRLRTVTPIRCVHARTRCGSSGSSGTAFITSPRIQRAPSNTLRFSVFQ
jgi:hypothetical protein